MSIKGKGRKRILIIKGDSNGCFPVPATKGGAVQTLIEELVCQNEKHRNVDMELVSFYDTKAKEKTEQEYPNTVFHWVKPNGLLRFFDKCAYWFFNKLLRKRDASSYKSIFSALYFISRSAKILKKEKYDAVILENYIPLIWIIKKSKYTGKFYFHLHNIPRTDAKCKKYMSKCNGFICVSQFVANEIAKPESPIGPIPKEKLHVVLNGVDIDRFKKIDDKQLIVKEKAKYGIKNHEKVLLFSGRLCKEKGVDVFLNALKGIDLNDCKILIVGGTNFSVTEKNVFYNHLIQLASEFGDKVIFTGFIAHNNMPLIYNMADIAVLPSKWNEPCALVIGEAISCCLPVITTNMGGIAEIADGGAVVLENDENLTRNISDLIVEFLEDETMKSMDKKIYDDYRAKHSLDVYYKNFINVLQNAISET